MRGYTKEFKIIFVNEMEGHAPHSISQRVERANMLCRSAVPYETARVWWNKNKEETEKKKEPIKITVKVKPKIKALFKVGQEVRSINHGYVKIIKKIKESLSHKGEKALVFEGSDTGRYSARHYEPVEEPKGTDNSSPPFKVGNDDKVKELMQDSFDGRLEKLEIDYKHIWDSYGAHEPKLLDLDNKVAGFMKALETQEEVFLKAIERKEAGFTKDIFDLQRKSEKQANKIIELYAFNDLKTASINELEATMQTKKDMKEIGFGWYINSVIIFFIMLFGSILGYIIGN